MTESIFLDGVALANYRAIGDELTKIGPFRRFNFFIGPNNAGKSCVLYFIANHLKPLVCDANTVLKLAALEVHRHSSLDEVLMALGVEKTRIRELISTNKPEIEGNSRIAAAIDAILNKICDGELILLGKKSNSDNRQFVYKSQLTHKSLRSVIPEQEWRDLWSWTALSEDPLDGLVEDEITELIEKLLLRTPMNLAPISLIPAIREISPRGDEFTDWSGKGLIEELARLQNPGAMERERFEIFQRINAFLKAVTQNDSAIIEIPHDRESVLVHMDGKVLPLSSLGTGIHEVVMLAAFCTLMENQIICVEEPEIHLHPLLQRRLIRYLEEQTSNQYFIATHSASFIDTPGAAVFHVSNHDGKTSIRNATTSNAKFDVCRDLGYKASDLLQANAVLWVEGPSDRIYLQHWIAAIDPALIEGIHYSIMFYGGRLLSHLSASDEEPDSNDADALIALLPLNRNLAIVIDSDKATEETPLNATKQRIQTEFADAGAIAWITAGREIENYVPEDVMTDALRGSYGKFGKRNKRGRFDHVLPFKNQEGKKVENIDKVRIARAVCSKPANLDILDLRGRIEKLVEMIQAANR